MADTIMTVDEILDFAIQNEQKAADLYSGLAEKATSRKVREEFLQFAKEEQGHAATLERVKRGQMLIGIEKQTQEINISDYSVDVEPGDAPDYQQILRFAIKQEEEAFRLYFALSSLVPEGEVKDLLYNLAKEEAKHKLRFENELNAHVNS